MNDYKQYLKYVQKILPNLAYSPQDKSENVSINVSYMLSRCQSMFRWSGLPDTIPARMLELMLQTNGNVAFYQHNDALYCFTGGLGGEPDAYYQPTVYTIANPALKLSVQARIGEDCVIMRNDSMFLGLLPLFARYAAAITETALSIYLATINSRTVGLISAPDDRTLESARQYLKDIAEGKQGIIAESAFFDGLRAQPYGSATSRTITELIELLQYQKASWYNDIGLNANYNMKREAIMSGESQLNNDALLPFVDDMLRERMQGAERVNAMFGTSISVALSSSWEDNAQQTEAELNNLEDGREDNAPAEA